MRMPRPNNDPPLPVRDYHSTFLPVRCVLQHRWIQEFRAAANSTYNLVRDESTRSHRQAGAALASAARVYRRRRNLFGATAVAHCRADLAVADFDLCLARADSDQS